jgi:hypothetical protein|tara:strand:- start:8514 stop:8765 length:252 start_codon:yes stop_codon:yes gene_type:complete
MALKLNPDGDVNMVRINDNLINVTMVTRIKLRDSIISVTMANDEDIVFRNRQSDSTIGELLTNDEFDELYEFFDIRTAYAEII